MNDTMAAAGAAGSDSGDDGAGAAEEKSATVMLRRYRREMLKVRDRNKLADGETVEDCQHGPHIPRLHRRVTLGALAWRVVAMCWQAHLSTQRNINPPESPQANLAQPVASASSAPAIPQKTAAATKAAPDAPIMTTSRPRNAINARSPSNAAAPAPPCGTGGRG